MSEWRIAAKRADFNLIGTRYGISPVLARLIRNRDIITDEEIDMYLNGTYDNLHDASVMTDMVKACSLIREYISEGKKFRVIGDYDVDGICATYILLKGLEKCGGKADYAIPHRVHDGYGINVGLIDDAHDDDVDVIITCDNGIAASEQIEHANELGIHVIVTDHHEVPSEEDPESGERIEILPPAEAVVDPHREGDAYPYSNICGAVVAWKLIGLLMPMCGVGANEADALMHELIEEASLATVCDVMELRDENRIIVKEGLSRIANTTNVGLRALINATGLSNKRITSYSYGFILGPCINASGRLDSADRSLALLLCDDPVSAAQLADDLKQYNEERKALTEQGIMRAIDDIESTSLKNDKVLVIYLPRIHESLAGLIAGRIREKYERPVIVFCDGEEGIKGSGRSIENYDMYTGLAAHKDLYLKFGGHKMAAGLTLNGDVVDELRARLNDSCTLKEEDMVATTVIDTELPFTYATESFVNELTKMEPCGNGNPKPVFALRNLKVLGAEPGRSERAPITITVSDSSERRYKLKYFGRGGNNTFLDDVDEAYGQGTAGDLCEGSARGIVMDIIYTPGINEYRGERSVEYTLNEYRFRL